MYYQYIMLSRSRLKQQPGRRKTWYEHKQQNIIVSVVHTIEVEIFSVLIDCFVLQYFIVVIDHFCKHFRRRNLGKTSNI